MRAFYVHDVTYVNWLAESRALDPRIWYLAVARLVVTAGFSMVFPFLAMYLSVERKVPALTVGAIWAVAGVLSAASQWVAGVLSDRYGRRPLMLGSMVLRSLNLAGMGLAVLSESSVLVIGALTVGNGVLRAFFDPPATALVADLVPVEQRVSAYSLQRVGTNIGWAAGPAAAGLAAGTSYAVLFFASVPISLLATFLVARIVGPGCEPAPLHPTAPRPRTDWRALRGDRVFVRFLLATAAFFILQVQLYQSISIYAAKVLHLDRAEVGTIYSLNGVLVVLLQFPAVRYIRRLGPRALVVGSLGYALAYASVGLAQGHGSLLVCIAAVTLAEIIVAPAQQTAVTSLAPAGRIGAYSGLFGLAQVVGQSSGPLIGTALLDHIPARGAWFALAIFGVLAAFGYQRVSRLGTINHQPKNPLAAPGPA